MPDAPAVPALPRVARHWGIATACVVHAPVFGWTAWALPWRAFTVFAFVTAALAALHLLTAAVAIARPAALRVPLRALALASLGYLGWIAWQFFAPALYVARIYGSLGQGVAAALAAGVGLVVLFTLPIGLWAFALGRGAGLARTTSVAGSLAFLALVGAALDANASARSVALPDSDNAAAVEREVAQALPAWHAVQAASQSRSLFTEAPVRCARPFDGRVATLVAHYVGRAGGVRAVCLQGAAGGLGRRLAGTLALDAARGPVAMDWLSSAQRLEPQRGLLGSLVDLLALRPGLDGACLGDRCLMPWQLLAMGFFTADEPSQYLPQVRLGFGVRGVRHALGEVAPEATVDGLVRVATHSFLIDTGGTLRAMTRLRPRDVVVDAASIVRAEEAAEAFLVAAQHPDGTFRYELDAYRDIEHHPNPSIPRHAGVTLVACELGSRGADIRRVIARGLDVLEGYAREVGPASALTYTTSERTADLGSSALGLVALATCRDVDGPKHDRLIGRLARLLLRTELPDGRFAPGMDLGSGAVLEGPTPLFAGGQAIMGLSLVERIAAKGDVASDARWPSVRDLHDAVERGMDYVAERYWPGALRAFFFLKENWHCAAARVSLPHHRHDGYERFCVDFVRSKFRMQLDHDDGVAPEFVGGLGFGNIVPPHNGSSAGMGEALAAAVDVMRARGLDVKEPLRRVRQGLAFLLRQQARPETCFACTSKSTLGWFSGYMVAPIGRIDHIEHAWSAIGHGARVLGLRSAAR